MQNENKLEQNYKVSNDVLKGLSEVIGPQGVKKVVRSFLDELPRAEAIIEQSLLQNDLDQIHKIGHKNKSSSKTVGALYLAELFLKLENCNNLEDAGLLSKEIKLNSDQVSLTMNDFISH